MKASMNLLWLLVLLTGISYDKIAFSQTDFWQQTKSPKSIYDLIIDKDGYVFAATSSDIYYSSDNGESWVKAGATDKHVLTLVIPVSCIYAGTYGEGILSSCDKGKSWRSWGMTSEQVGSMNSIITSIIQNSKSYILAGTGGDGIYLEEGSGWVLALPLGDIGDRIHQFVKNSTGDIFVATSRGLLHSWTDGMIWAKTSLTRHVRSLAINSKGEIFAGTKDKGIFRSSNNGQTWSEVNKGLKKKSVLSLAIAFNDHIYAGVEGKGIFRSTDNGESWTEFSSGIKNGANVSSIAFSPSGHIFVGTEEDGIFRSSERYLPELPDVQKN
jgi:ligand-binding sensor domain-containing protein